MLHPDFKIEKYANDHRSEIISIWEKSVLATHHFLKPGDFQVIKRLVEGIDFSAFDVYCLTTKSKVAGFVGVADKKIEMLFLSPDHFGKKLGKALMDFALQQLNADKVDVNEQNLSAVGFYKKFGFKTYERTEKDDQGNDYPLLRMRL